MEWQFIYYTPLLLLFIARTQVKERYRENCGLERRSRSLLGSLRFDDGIVNDIATNQ